MLDGGVLWWDGVCCGVKGVCCGGMGVCCGVKGVCCGGMGVCCGVKGVCCVGMGMCRLFSLVVPHLCYVSYPSAMFHQISTFQLPSRQQSGRPIRGVGVSVSEDHIFSTIVRTQGTLTPVHTPPHDTQHQPTPPTQSG